MPPDVWRWLFVSCEMCGKEISDEDRHGCALLLAYQHERNSARAAKMLWLTQHGVEHRP